MSGVVLRCANCGTVQPSPGECETCHGAEVRYFCSNHDPGRWLDGPVCQECGARFGEAAVPTTAGRDRSHAGYGGVAIPASGAESEPALAALRCRLETHEILLKALLTHLAMTSPDSFGAIIGGLVRSEDVPNDVAQELTALVEEIAASLRG